MLKFNNFIKLLTILILCNFYYPLTNGNNRRKRIVGGYDISIDEIPYLVSIQSRLIHVHQCGGSIIAPKWILSAAHCPISGNRRYFVLVAANSDATNGKSFYIIQVIKHPQFNRVSMDYDIALFKLDYPITAISGGHIIQLPQRDNLFKTGDDVFVSGWGSDGQLAWYDRSYKDKLRQVHLNIIDHKVCTDKYRNQKIITKNMICAGKMGKDACDNDSGGPLIYYDTSRGDILIGIVSWGGKCGDNKHPGIYTNVSAFLKWIYDTQNQHK